MLLTSHHLNRLQSVKECVGSMQACTKLWGWRDRLMTLRDRTGTATTRTLSIQEAIGWDVETTVLRLFNDLWAIPAYSKYMQEILCMACPAGSYQESCKNCHMDHSEMTKQPTTLVCECNGQQHSKLARLDDAAKCTEIRNMDGEAPTPAHTPLVPSRPHSGCAGSCSAGIAHQNPPSQHLSPEPPSYHLNPSPQHQHRYIRTPMSARATCATATLARLHHAKSVVPKEIRTCARGLSL